MCTVLLPPGDNQIAVNKYIISYQVIIAGRRLTVSGGVYSDNLFVAPAALLLVPQKKIEEGQTEWFCGTV